MSFQVAPGYHKVSLKLGRFTPTQAVNLKSGEQAYSEADWERPNFGKFMVPGLASANDMHLTLKAVGRVLDRTTKRDDLKPERLSKILATANPSGVEPMATAIPAPAVGRLTDDAIERPIFQGMHDADPNLIGYTPNDNQTAMLSGLAVNGGVSEYTITVYTKSTWIEKQAAEAYRLMRPFTVEDVIENLRSDVIIVAANPSTPGKLTEQGIAAGSSAAHVVLSDESKKTVVQPLQEEIGGVSVESAFRFMQYGAVLATFSPTQLKAVENKMESFSLPSRAATESFSRSRRTHRYGSLLGDRK